MNSGESLHGRGASAGRYRGYAQVCRSGDGVDDIPLGCILVVDAVDFATARAFGRIGALIAEHGGILSNSLSVAREDGIPAVVGIAGATRLIKNGDELVVDGARGLVLAVAGGAASSLTRCIGA